MTSTSAVWRMEAPKTGEDVGGWYRNKTCHTRWTREKKLLFFCNNACFWRECERIFGVNPRDADHRDLKLAAHGEGIAIA